MTRTITLSSPATWPFPTGVVPGEFTTSGRGYVANSGGQVNVLPIDVGVLTALGFTVSGNIGVIGQYLNVPVGDQNGILIPLPINYAAGAQYLITNIVAIGVGDVPATTGSGGILTFETESDTGIGSIAFAWASAGRAINWNSSVPIALTVNPLWLSTQAANGWSPADDGTICNIFITGYQVG